MLCLIRAVDISCGPLFVQIDCAAPVSTAVRNVVAGKTSWQSLMYLMLLKDIASLPSVQNGRALFFVRTEMQICRPRPEQQISLVREFNISLVVLGNIRYAIRLLRDSTIEGVARVCYDLRAKDATVAA